MKIFKKIALAMFVLSSGLLQAQFLQNSGVVPFPMAPFEDNGTAKFTFILNTVLEDIVTPVIDPETGNISTRIEFVLRNLHLVDGDTSLLNNGILNYFSAEYTIISNEEARINLTQIADIPPALVLRFEIPVFATGGTEESTRYNPVHQIEGRMYTELFGAYPTIITQNYVLADSDRDGYGDVVADFDSDNDGILDEVEGLTCSFENISNRLGIGANQIDASGVVDVSDLFGYEANSETVMVNYSNVYTNALGELITRVQGEGRDEVYPYIEINSKVKFRSRITFDGQMDPNEVNVALVPYNGPRLESIAGAIDSNLANDIVYEESSFATEDSFYIYRNKFINTTSNTLNNSGPFGITNVLSPEGRPVFSKVLKINYYNEGVGEAVVNFDICLIQDTDKDTIPDYLDLDSDNDGCPDAVEKGTNFEFINLVESPGLLNGQDVNLNMGTTITDLNGVPTAVGAAGATIGLSTDASLTRCTVYAVNDINQVPVNTKVNGNVLSNDITVLPLTVEGGTYLDENGEEKPLTLGTPTLVYGKDGKPAGTLTLNPDGTYSYVPEPNSGFVGVIPITYTITNGPVGNLEIIVAPKASVVYDDAPIAQNDTASTLPTTPVSGNVLNNDSEPDGETLTVVEATVGGVAITLGASAIISGVDSDGNPVANAGELRLNANGTYDFFPAPGFTGKINPITYTVSDKGTNALRKTDVAELSIGVYPNVGNIIHANDDANSAPKGISMTGNVLANDSDPEGNTQSVTAATAKVLVNTNSYEIPLVIDGNIVNIQDVGSLVLGANGAYTFVPVATFVGTVVIPYTICNDGGAPCSTATLYLTSLETDAACYRDGIEAAAGVVLPTSTAGISTLNRLVGLDSWQDMPRNAFLVLESKEKGFVITRIAGFKDQTDANPTISVPVEGMLIFDVDANCLKMYANNEWFCLAQGCIE